MAFSALLPLAVYAAAMVYHFGASPGAAGWLRDIIVVRDALYRQRTAQIPVGQRKVLIAGGSGTLFGVSSAQIEHALDQPVFNFGLHAGIDIDFVMAETIAFVRAGDQVILPLEMEYYSRLSPSEETSPNFSAYLYLLADRIPVRSLIEFVLASPPKRIVELAAWRLGAQFGIAERWPIPADESTVLAEWRKARAAPLPPGYGPHVYDFTSMDQHGDKSIYINTPSTTLAALLANATSTPEPLSPYALRHLAAWRDIVSQHGGEFLLTWPVILEDDHGTIFTDVYWAEIVDLARSMANAGMPIHCDPIQALVPRQYRLDTTYHLNAKGQKIYSAALAACIKNIEKRSFDYQSANPKDLAQQARERIAGFRVPPDPLYFAYERNIRQLQALKATLDAAYLKDGRYPDALPAVEVPSAASFPPAKLWYRSSGDGFKLVIEDPDECRIVRLAWPALMDPTRSQGPDGCSAYGYWTASAADW